MHQEKSCGFVIFKKNGKNILYAIIQHTTGHHGFPKGHIEKNETELETAFREVKEEIGTVPTIVEGFREVICYNLPFKNNVLKEVVYFLGYVEDTNLVCQESELLNAQFFSLENALDVLEHQQSRDLLIKVNDFLLNVYL